MSKVKQAVVFGVALGAAILLSSLSSLGNMQIAKKEKVACTTCHVKMGQKDLNDVGKCYAKKKSLKACESGSKEGKK
ncbi:MAG: hypothetical protein EPN47_20150 [Acidobacteria bacterium]|nr:MAG: hypothetical protein EPN47_20150 [Acidobacteriota bacterium]